MAKVVGRRIIDWREMREVAKIVEIDSSRIVTIIDEVELVVSIVNWQSAPVDGPRLFLPKPDLAER